MYNHFDNVLAALSKKEKSQDRHFVFAVEKPSSTANTPFEFDVVQNHT